MSRLVPLTLLCAALALAVHEGCFDLTRAFDGGPWPHDGPPDLRGPDAWFPDGPGPDRRRTEGPVPDGPQPDRRLVDGPRPDGPKIDGPKADLPLVVPGTFVKVLKGKFTMGSPNGEKCRENTGAAETEHEVTLSRDLDIMDAEVTQTDYASVMGTNPSAHTGCSTCPVEKVTWHEAAAYCNMLSSKKALAPCYACQSVMGAMDCKVATGYENQNIYTCKGYRLPTEAEWEYAYRAGFKTSLYTNKNVTTCTGTDAEVEPVAWYSQNSTGQTHLVKGKTKNGNNLFDMAGNVLEWCHDWYQQDLGKTAITDPAIQNSTKVHVLRGGAYALDAQRVRAADRGFADGTTSAGTVGFRCARTP